MPAIIAALMGALGRLFASRIGTWIAAALLWLGMSWTTMEVALEPTIDALKAFAAGGGPGGGGGPYFAVAQQWAGVMHFDDALTMVVSAYITRQIVVGAKLALRQTPIA